MTIFKTPKGPTELATLQDLWASAGAITVVQATLLVGDRDAASVDALAATKTAKYEIPPWGNVLETRFQTKADDDGWVVEMWAARGKTDHYDLAAILALTGGKCEADGTAYFVDTITATETFNNAGAIVHSASDDIARYIIDMDGYSDVVFIATTIEAAATLTVQCAVH